MAKGKKGKKGARNRRLAKTVKKGDISPEAVEKGRQEFDANKAAEANRASEPESEAEPASDAKAERIELPTGAAALQKFDDVLGAIEQAAVALFLSALVLTATVNTIKKLAFGSGFEWASEAIRYSVFFTAISGAILASQAKRMMSMDIVNRLLSERGRAYARMIVAVFVLVICYYFLRGGLDAHESLLALNDTYDLISPKLAIWAIPVGAVLIGFHYLLHLGIDVVCLSKGVAPPEPEMSAH